MGKSVGHQSFFHAISVYILLNLSSESTRANYMIKFHSKRAFSVKIDGKTVVRYANRDKTKHYVF